MIETETLLVACPRCGAWPMAASTPKPYSATGQIKFRCPKCHTVEDGRVRKGTTPHGPELRVSA